MAAQTASQSFNPHIRQRGDDHPLAVPYRPLPRPEVALPRLCAPTHEERVSRTLSYNRFVERQAQVGIHLLLFLQTCASSKCAGISIIDSTPLASCHIKRMHMHRTIRGWRPRPSIVTRNALFPSQTIAIPL